MSNYLKQHRDNLQRMNKALDDGLLFNHSFEISKMSFPAPQVAKIKNGEHEISDYLEIMNGNKDRSIHSDYRDLHGNEDGFRCMATTYIHRDIKVQVYNVMNRGAFLFDGNDRENFRCIISSDSSMGTNFSDKTNILTVKIGVKDGQSYPEGYNADNYMQVDPSLRSPVIKKLHIQHDKIDKKAYDEIARKRIGTFISETLEAESKKPGMIYDYNEVNADVKLKAICAISYDMRNSFIKEDSFRKPATANNAEEIYHVVALFALKAHLNEKYGIAAPIIANNCALETGAERFKELNMKKEVFEENCNELRRMGPQRFHMNQIDLHALLKLAQRGFELQSKVLKMGAAISA